MRVSLECSDRAKQSYQHNQVLVIRTGDCWDFYFGKEVGARNLFFTYRLLRVDKLLAVNLQLGQVKYRIPLQLFFLSPRQTSVSVTLHQFQTHTHNIKISSTGAHGP